MDKILDRLASVAMIVAAITVLWVYWGIVVPSLERGWRHLTE